MRLLENAAHGDSADHARELKGSGDDGSLTGGHRDRFARIPLAMEDPLHPFSGRHQSGQLLWEIDSSLVPEPEFAAVVRKAVYAQAHSSVIGENITGFEDRFMRHHYAVRAFPEDPALELPAVEGGVTGAKRREVFRRIFVLQHNCGGHDFEHRPRRKLSLDGTIEQRLLPVLVETLPIVCRDTHGEIIWVQGRMAHHRQDFAGARVQRDGGSRARSQGLLGNLLQIVIDRQQNLLSGNGFLCGQAIDFFADTVHDHAPHAVGALKQVVVLALQTALSREVAGAESAVAYLDLLFADFTDIARSMSKKSPRQVTPAVHGDHFQDGNVRTVRFDEGDVRGRSVGLDDDGLELREILRIVKLIMQIIQGNSQTFRDACQMFLHLRQIITQEEHAEGRPIVHKHAAFAVQHAAARGNPGNVAHAVALGQRAVLIRIDDLELPEAEQQHAYHSHDDVGCYGQPRLRQSIVVAEPVRHENPAREYFFPGLSARSGPI